MDMEGGEWRLTSEDVVFWLTFRLLSCRARTSRSGASGISRSSRSGGAAGFMITSASAAWKRAGKLGVKRRGKAGQMKMWETRKKLVFARTRTNGTYDVDLGRENVGWDGG